MNKLLERIPTFLQEYREYKVICDAILPEFTALETAIKSVFNAQFIFTCEESYISLYENMLAEKGLLVIDKSLTLDERRIKIYNLYNNAIPYTKITIPQKLYAIVPKECIQIEQSRHKVNFRIDEEYLDKADAIKEMLDEILPLDMIITTEQNKTTHAQLERYTHAQLEPYTHKQIETLEV